MKFDEMVEQIFEENAEEDTLFRFSHGRRRCVGRESYASADNNNKNDNKKSNEKNASATDDDDKTKANASTATTSTTTSSDKRGNWDFQRNFSPRLKINCKTNSGTPPRSSAKAITTRRARECVYLNSAESRLLLRFGLNTTNSTNTYGQMKPSFIPWDETSWKKYLKFWRAEDSLPSECTKRGQQSKSTPLCGGKKLDQIYQNAHIFCASVEIPSSCPSTTIGR